MNENRNDLTFFLEDGRKAEKKITQLSLGEEQQIVTELWAEPKIEKKLSQKIVEYKKPLVYKREIETIDENTGSVVDKQVESLDSDVKVQYKEIPVPVQAQSVGALSVDTSEFVTREDLKGALAETTMALTRVIKQSQEVVKQPVNTLNYQDLIKEKNEQKDTDEKGVIGWTVLAAVSILFVYVAFFL